MTTSLHKRTTEVAIIGAGPTGLFLANRLLQLGIKCIAIERRAKQYRHSRSIGIHPPSLRMLEQLGFVTELVGAGVKVPKGKAYGGARLLGELSFDACPKPYNFVLAVPQFETERILESRIMELDPECLHRNVLVKAVKPLDDGVLVTMSGDDDERVAEIFASYVVGCGGRESIVRETAGIAYRGGPYADTFVMGDFKDKTDFGDEARIFLDGHGLAESFPLPDKMRRWVVQTDELKEHPEEEHFAKWVRERSGHDLAGSLTGLLTSFRVHHFMADRFYSGRMLLAGDAAHVMSPIGAQGMNTGWRDAWDVAAALHKVLRESGVAEDLFAAYDTTARARAQLGIERAEMYMAIGRKPKHPFLRNAMLSAVLHSPLRNRLARMVTMNE